VTVYKTMQPTAIIPIICTKEREKLTACFCFPLSSCTQVSKHHAHAPTRTSTSMRTHTLYTRSLYQKERRETIKVKHAKRREKTNRRVATMVNSDDIDESNKQSGAADDNADEVNATVTISKEEKRRILEMCGLSTDDNDDNEENETSRGMKSGEKDGKKVQLPNVNKHK